MGQTRSVEESTTESAFRRVGEADTDGRRRISLGRVGNPEHHRYEVYENDHGELLLVPVVSIPARELAVLQNPALHAALLRGLEQAAYGKVVNLGSFSEFLDEDDD
jgi:hypothetical protein